MARTVLWNRVLLDEFIDLASLSEDEERVIRARAAGWSRVKMCHEYNMSLAAIDRIVARLKSKYDAVQPYSDKLPVRKIRESIKRNTPRQSRQGVFSGLDENHTDDGDRVRF